MLFALTVVNYLPFSKFLFYEQKERAAMGNAITLSERVTTYKMNVMQFDVIRDFFSFNITHMYSTVYSFTH